MKENEIPKRIFLPQENEHDYCHFDFWPVYHQNNKYMDYLENLVKSQKMELQKIAKNEKIARQKIRENYDHEIYLNDEDLESVLSEDFDENSDNIKDDPDFDPYEHGSQNCTYDWSLAISFGDSQGFSERQISKFINRYLN